VVVRRTRFELNKARDRGHVLVGLAIAVVNIDEVIAIIRSSKDPAEARERLTVRDWPSGDMTPLIDLIQDPRTVIVEAGRVRLTDEQARAILALTLARLTGLGRDEIFDEARLLSDTIRVLLEILGDRGRVMAIMREELVEVREQFAVPRRTTIMEGDSDLEDEDLIAREDMVVTVTHGGYVKRTPLNTYRQQKRGGRGRSAMATKDEDAVTRVFSASTHAPVLFFSSEGQVYTLKVWRLPVGLPNTKGRSFNNLLPLGPGETITSILPLPEDPSFWDRTDVMFATQSGGVRRNKLSDFQRINRAGKMAMKLDEGDHIIGVQLCTEDQDVLLTTALGRCIRFAVDDVRVFAGRESTGVRGVRLAEGDQVISMAILRRVGASPAERLAYLRHASAMRAAAGEPGEEEPTADTEEVADIADADEAAAGAELTDESAEASVSFERIAELGAAEEFILTLTDSGYGKRTSSYDYRRSRRGGQGIAAFNMERRGGRLVASFPVEETDGLLLVTDAGQLIRVPVRDIRIASRNTQGVTVLRTAGHERVVSVERLAEPAGSEADGETDLPETDGTQTSGSQTDGSDPDGTEAG
jgi:DNA gyrase subunit A